MLRPNPPDVAPSRLEMAKAEDRIATLNLTPEQHLAVSSAWAALLYFRKLAMRLDKPIEQLTLDDLLHNLARRLASK